MSIILFKILFGIVAIVLIVPTLYISTVSVWHFGKRLGWIFGLFDNGTTAEIWDTYGPIPWLIGFLTLSAIPLLYLLGSFVLSIFKVAF